MNKLGWIIVLCLLLIVYGGAFVFFTVIATTLAAASASTLAFTVPIFILLGLPFVLTAKQVYDTPW